MANAEFAEARLAEAVSKASSLPLKQATEKPALRSTRRTFFAGAIVLIAVASVASWWQTLPNSVPEQVQPTTSSASTPEQKPSLDQDLPAAEVRPEKPQKRSAASSEPAEHDQDTTPVPDLTGANLDQLLKDIKKDLEQLENR